MRITTYKAGTCEATGTPIAERQLQRSEVSHCQLTGTYTMSVTQDDTDYLIDISQHDLQMMADEKSNKPLEGK